MKNRYRKKFVNNRRVVNVLRLDPTRTTMLRKAFVARLRRQFARLGLAIHDLIVKEDALGLRERRRTIAQLMVGNAFCPTGEGGGIDPTCSPAGGGGGSLHKRFVSKAREVASSYQQSEDGAPLRLKRLILESVKGGRLEAFHPGKITLYRGGNAKGMSWSKDKSTALKFAKENAGFGLAKLHEIVIDETVPALDIQKMTRGMSVRSLSEREVVVLKSGDLPRKTTEYRFNREIEFWDKVRPTTDNAFCPTGEGGGVDPTCSPGGDGDSFREDNYKMGDLMDGKIIGDRLKNLVHKDNPKRDRFLKTVVEMFSNDDTNAKLRKMMSELASMTVEGGPLEHLHPGEGDYYRGGESRGVRQSASSHTRDKKYAKMFGKVKKVSITKQTPALDFDKVTGDKTFKEILIDTRKLTTNAFCPTGEGGGVDPTCGNEGGGASSLSNEESDAVDLWKLSNWGRIKREQREGGHLGNAFNRALDKMPVATSDSYRGVTITKDSDAYNVGKTVTFKTSESFSSDQNFAEGWAEEHPSVKGNLATGDRIPIVLIVPRTIDIRQIGGNQSEVVNRPGMTVKVDRVDYSGPVRRVYTSLVPTTNTRWRFETDPEKLKQFQAWLRRQLKLTVLSATDEELWERYVMEGYKRGAGRAFDDVRVAERAKYGAADRLDFYKGSREQFLKSAFGRPESAAKVRLIAERTYDELEGMTADMSLKLGRALADGLVQGSNPVEIARGLSRQLGLSRNRAEVIARTEIIRAHAEGQLNAMSDLGVEEIGVMVEWSTAGDDRVCDLCSPMEGVVLRIEEAKGMIPRHPNCRCAFVPANVGESTAEQTRGKARVERAVRESSDRANSDGFDTNVPVSRSRPQSVLNAFCPTGEGGGIDPTCSPSGVGAISQMAEHSSSLPDDHKETVRSYQEDGSFDPLNNYLRTGRLAPTKKMEGMSDSLFQGGFGDDAKGWADQQIKELSSVLSKSEIPEPITVYRGVDEGTFDDAQVGSTIHDKGFMSTSLDREQGEGFSAPYGGKGAGTLLKIDVPKGAKGLYTDPVLDLKQREVLFDKGQKMLVTKISIENGRRVIHATMQAKGARSTTRPLAPSKSVKAAIYSAASRHGSDSYGKIARSLYRNGHNVSVDQIKAVLSQNRLAVSS